jgi:membrane-associated protease RseP (regulator of RpoE activity)
MKLSACTALALTLLAASPPAALADGTAVAKTNGRCPEGHPETGDLGIESLLCVSGSCAVNMRTDAGYTHMFSTEPRIRGLVGGGPAAGKLMDGDVLIAIDGVLITTREGGRRLANLKPGDPVTLRIRRGREEMDVTLVPRLGCNMPGLAVLMGSPTPRPAVAPRPALETDPALTPRPARAPRPAPAPEPAQAPQAAAPAIAPRAATSAVTPRPAVAPKARPEARPEKPPFTFGLELECGSCGWRSDHGGALRWSSPALPTVRSVEPGGPGAQAGLQPGDVLVEIDGHVLNNEEAGREIGKLRPGHAVQVRFLRGREDKTVSITPRGEMPASQPF